MITVALPYAEHSTSDCDSVVEGVFNINRRAHFDDDPDCVHV